MHVPATTSSGTLAWLLGQLVHLHRHVVPVVFGVLVVGGGALLAFAPRWCYRAVRRARDRNFRHLGFGFVIFSSSPILLSYAFASPNEGVWVGERILEALVVLPFVPVGVVSALLLGGALTGRRSYGDRWVAFAVGSALIGLASAVPGLGLLTLVVVASVFVPAFGSRERLSF